MQMTGFHCESRSSTRRLFFLKKILIQIVRWTYREIGCQKWNNWVAAQVVNDQVSLVPVPPEAPPRRRVTSLAISSPLRVCFLLGCQSTTFANWIFPFLVSVQVPKRLAAFLELLVAWKVVENLETFGFDLKWLEGRRGLTAPSDFLNCVALVFTEMSKFVGSPTRRIVQHYFVKSPVDNEAISPKIWNTTCNWMSSSDGINLMTNWDSFVSSKVTLSCALSMTCIGNWA